MRVVRRPRACRSMLARRLRLDVYDRDRNKADGDTLGFAYVNLDLIAEGQVTEQWVQMRGSFTGELRIRMLVLSGTDDSVEVCPCAVACAVEHVLAEECAGATPPCTCASARGPLVQVREEATRALETSQVVYTTDAVKCTVVRAEGLPPNCRGKQMLVEVTYNNVMQATAKRVAGKERSIECAPSSDFDAHPVRPARPTQDGVVRADGARTCAIAWRGMT